MNAFLIQQMYVNATDGYGDYIRFFGEGTGPILITRLRCSGDEHRLIDCSYSNVTDDIAYRHDQGVICKNGGFH